MTVREAVDAARDTLSTGGLDAVDAAIDARVLAGEAFGLDRAALIVRGDEQAGPAALARLDAFVSRRLRREPVAYILGRREFYGREFVVSPAVLVPRPEPEIIIDAAIGRFARDTAFDVLDVGTGSGCLAVTLALEFPRARVWATDVSAAALGVARENARRHDVSGRVTFRQASLTAGAGPVELLVSNPPYVPNPLRRSLPPEVGEHEPPVALFGGPDGLDVIRALIAEASRALTRPGASAGAPSGGWLLLECGIGQADEIQRLLDATGCFDAIHALADLRGSPRTIAARRR